MTFVKGSIQSFSIVNLTKILPSRPSALHDDIENWSINFFFGHEGVRLRDS